MQGKRHCLPRDRAEGRTRKAVSYSDNFAIRAPSLDALRAVIFFTVRHDAPRVMHRGEGYLPRDRSLAQLDRASAF